MDEGPPSSFLLLAEETPVYCSDGIVAGKVREVLSDSARDIFDGLVVVTRDGQEKYVAADHVRDIHERGVDIDLPSSGVGELPAPEKHRSVKYDLGGEPRHTWSDVLRWLVDHLPHVSSGGDRRLDRARARLAERDKARQLAREDPRLALEAGVGRPDLPNSLDGGLVDVNNAPPAVIASLPGFDTALAGRVVAAREQVDGFSSLEDLGSVLDLSAAEVERVRDHTVFLPR